ncbi:hypothetical protein AB0J86_33220 [Micromonospora sp. NPDC049559]|uniref:hypothetical protein n=1 Tax=Micromonospora sp. NPDC049559 TaxID=3155923 RepID=UPI003426D1FF
MGILRRGDEPMHYEDGSHRWVPPDPDMDQEAWEVSVRAHQEKHREMFGARPKATRDGPAT